MCLNQVTNLQRQAQPKNINGRWGRQKNFDASRCKLNCLLFFLVLLQSCRSLYFLPEILWHCCRLTKNWTDLHDNMIVLVPSTNTFECGIHTFTVITPEYRFISPYSKMEEKRVLFFKIQQPGMKPCCECILYCMRKEGCFELPFPLNLTYTDKYQIKIIGQDNFRS